MSLTLLPSRPSTAFSVAVTSGKGGVGKTSVSINLAAALARIGRRVALFDADFALGTSTSGWASPGIAPGDVLDGDRSLTRSRWPAVRHRCDSGGERGARAGGAELAQ
jgi:Mrp family chromosome partitioning ATPase